MSDFTNLIYEFPAVSTKMENIVILTKAYIAYFKERASLENEYGKGIHTQSTVPMKTSLFNKENPVDKTESTLKAMLETINSESEKIGQKHLETASKILNEIVKPLEALVKDIEVGKKKLINDTNKSINSHNALVTAAEKAKVNYKKAVTEHKNAVEAGKTLEGPAQEKNNIKIGQLDAKVKKLEADYRAAVDKANTTREVLYQTELPEVLKGCQELISKHYETFKAVLDQFVVTHIELSTIIADVSQRLRGNMEHVSYEADLEEFIKANLNVHEIKNIELELEEATAPTEEKKEETPVEEEKKEETPIEEEKKEETPIEEEKKEVPTEEEKKEETPVEEQKTE
ncbi:Hypothetical protein EHI5A_061680 [Entamoeba histolytica KU27]|uniref:F-BAR domain-containing protein n=1 Tax=Entamoeba histolytica KU27 TaxID=885311 RepID=M2Q7P1_ENTHI|nr:Hypothetical protein EHI5A_061680 [Entamoeba histolytica KU27]